MLHIEQVLTRLKIRTASRHLAVQDVRELIETSANPISAAKTIITNLGVIEYTTSDPTEARMTAQRLVDEALILGDKFDPDQALRKAAEKIAQQRIESPWYFTKAVTSSVVTTTETKEGIQVEMKTDGTFKKGSKKLLAVALYEKHKALSNKEIIAVFMKEMDMSEAGSRTYLYNLRSSKRE